MVGYLKLDDLVCRPVGKQSTWNASISSIIVDTIALFENEDELLLHASIGRSKNLIAICSPCPSGSPIFLWTMARRDNVAKPERFTSSDKVK